jgi:hypothetical protein
LLPYDIAKVIFFTLETVNQSLLELYKAVLVKVLELTQEKG